MRLYLRPQGKDEVPGKVLFSSSKKWLHPLFELEEFLASRGKGDSTFEFDNGLVATPLDLFLRDRIIGIAAAFLVVRLGLRFVETDLISFRAREVLEGHSVAIETKETTEAIACSTEKLLKKITDVEKAYAIILARRAKALEK
jgi:hypothetical protein